MVHRYSDEGVLCKLPLGHEDTNALDKLVTLKAFAAGAWEIADVKILICVKSIGAKKKRTGRSNTNTQELIVSRSE